MFFSIQGEEIGMTDVSIPRDKIMDPQALGTGPKDIGKSYNRDQTRSPFQWDDSINAGFSTASSTWLPVAENYTINNVKVQRSQTRSHLNVFKKLSLLRQNPTMKHGAFDIKAFNDDNVIVYKRQMTKALESDVFVIVLNLSSSKQIVRLTDVFEERLPIYMTVAIASIHSTTIVPG